MAGSGVGGESDRILRLEEKSIYFCNGIDFGFGMDGEFDFDESD